MRVNFKDLEARISLECEPTFREFEVRTETDHETSNRSRLSSFILMALMLTPHLTFSLPPFFCRMDIIFVEFLTTGTMTLLDA